MKNLKLIMIFIVKDIFVISAVNVEVKCLFNIIQDVITYC